MVLKSTDITFFLAVELISTVVDTDYENWAVLVQCSKPPSSDPISSPPSGNNSCLESLSIAIPAR